MNILVTAGNTQVPIDQVRCITNIFTGRTGAQIALEAFHRKHAVTLVTSHPEALWQLTSGAVPAGPLTATSYRTFDELRATLQQCVRPGPHGYDVVIHAAAVSDYLVEGAYVPAAGTLIADCGLQIADSPALPHQSAIRNPQSAIRIELLNTKSGKIKSHHSELWLRLVPAPKLVDLIRRDWGFRGILVKFKLEVGMSQEQLLEVAEPARLQSEANLMVANTLEGSHAWAYVGPIAGKYQKVDRARLPVTLLEAIERL